MTSMLELDRSVSLDDAANELCLVLGFRSVKAYQQWHGLLVDDWPGPITIAHMNTPRCGRPDVEDEAYRAIVGSGSFPQPCQKEGVLVHYDKSRFPKSWLDNWPEIQEKTFKAYADMGGRMRETLDENAAHIRVWATQGAGWIGLAQFNNRSCSGSVFHQLSYSYIPNDLVNQMCRLHTHEFGHNVNLQHTRGGVMNPTILSGPFNGWERGDPSYDTLVRFFGGEPLDPDKPEEKDNYLMIGGKKAEIIGAGTPSGPFRVRFSSGSNQDWFGELK